MAKGNASKFLEGAVAGVALSVAASMFLASRKGGEFKVTITDVIADFYKSISPKVKKIKKMGEKEYKEFMKNAVGKYTKTKMISDDMTKELAKDVEQSWKHFSKYLGT